MTRPKALRVPPIAAALRAVCTLLLCSPAAFAQGQRTGDSGFSGGPVVSPTVNSGPTSTPGFGSGVNVPGANIPGTSLNAGVSVPGRNGGPASASVPSAGAASVGAPSAADLKAQGEKLSASAPGAASAGLLAPESSARGAGSSASSLGAPASRASADSDPGARLMRPAGDEKSGGRSVGAGSALGSAVKELGQAKQLEAAGITGSEGQTLGRIFDAEGKNSTRIGDRPAGAVAGKTEKVRDQVRQTVKIADTASPHDAPALYQDAIRIADEAGKKKLISLDTAKAVGDAVVQFAYRRAARALPQLADDAYKNAAAGQAGKAAVERDFKGFSNWDKFLGTGETKQLVSNEADLKADVQRTLEQASRPGAKSNGVARRVSFRREGDVFVAELPMRAAGSAAALPQDFLRSLALDARAAGREPVPALALTQTPGLFEGARAVYSYARRAGRSRAASASLAASFFTRAAYRSFWQTVGDVIAAVVGRIMPGRVDLGGGKQLVSNDRGLSRLSVLNPKAQAGSSLILMDLARLERDGRAAELAASRGASTVGELKAMLARLDELAASYARLTGDAAAPAAAAALKSRAGAYLALADDASLPEDARALASAETPGGAAFWLSRLPQAKLDFVDRQMLGAARRGGVAALAYADLAGGQARLVAPKPTQALAAQLETLGFETELGSNGSLRAWASGPGLEERVDAALALASGGSSATAADTAAVTRAAEFAAAHPSDARRQAQRLQAEDPALTGFAPAGVVESQGRPLWAESSVRRVAGKLSRVVLLRDLDTRRPLFGRAEPLPAR